MINIDNIKEIYLSLGYTDMRKQADGLLVVVKSICKDIDLMNKLFMFCNKEKNKLKILEVDYDGIWVYYKRLNDSKFRWPKNGNDKIDKR
jgi:transposase